MGQAQPVGSDSGQRLDWLDGLRAYAIGLVILSHSFIHFGQLPPIAVRWLSLGGYGVQLFFVISAATISLTLSRGSASGLLSWGTKRFFRIAPLYYAAILFYGLWRAVFPGPEEPAFVLWAGAAAANALFLHGWVPPAINSIVPGGWSIAAEMTFYLFAPFAFAWLRSGGHRAVVVLASVAAFLVVVQTAMRTEIYSYFFYWPPAHLPVFILAMLVVHWNAGLLFSGQAATARSTLVATTLCIGGLGAGAALHMADAHPASIAALGLGFAGLLLLAPGPLRFWFANRVAVAVGRVSYSMYITHFAVLRVCVDLFRLDTVLADAPVLGTITLFLVTLVASYLVSRLTYNWIEKPGIKIGRSLAERIRWHHSPAGASDAQRSPPE